MGGRFKAQDRTGFGRTGGFGVTEGKESYLGADLLAGWPGPDDSSPLAGTDPQGQLESILLAAASAFRFIRENTNQGRLIDRNRYGAIISMLDTITGFTTFSLAEYTYELEGSTPGVRLWLEGRAGQRRVALVFFPDVRQWRVDWRDRKISLELLSLDLSPEGIAGRPGPEMEEICPAGEDWPRSLFRGLFLPLTLEIPPE
jgi:hypothetical protein